MFDDDDDPYEGLDDPETEVNSLPICPQCGGHAYWESDLSTPEVRCEDCGYVFKV